MDRDANGDITNHVIMGKEKTEEKHLNEGPKSPIGKIRLDILSTLFRRITTKNHWKKNFKIKFKPR